jgi:hypothetical protein
MSNTTPGQSQSDRRKEENGSETSYPRWRRVLAAMVTALMRMVNTAALVDKVQRKWAYAMRKGELVLRSRAIGARSNGRNEFCQRRSLAGYGAK